MKQGAFVSSWLPGLNFSAPRSRSAKCHASPQMSIVSHEKLQVLFESETSELAQYKIELEIPASHSKDKRRQSVQALRKNADFKGFRKGTIPPFIMKDIPGFVLRDSIEELLEEALQELKLEKTDGDAADPDIDFEEMMGRFNVGEDFRFSLEMPLRKVLSLDTESLTQDILDVKSDVDLSDAESDAMSKTAEAEASQPST
ncbi:unnamed protein product [Chondrus crispus]|uniref:Trigger factor ribosome-binding bacterial domain-containing protein n=1 Tax=Chondrus crispus TaxID=2769 RepID=R7QTQ2_CHOCR|nr:unnamed protein product [Chondrus crispus]CDF41078.1 unnamed protein product [Chondrus crispus]|eukprot:XP_005711372.1 unnamed protein product [Chondrus crispus]